MKFKQAKTHTIQFMRQGISLKSERETHDLNHDLTFFRINNQLWMPQYEVNVQSTWDVNLGGRDLYTIGSFSIQAYIHILVFVTKVSREDHKSWSFDEPLSFSLKHSSTLQYYYSYYLNLTTSENRCFLKEQMQFTRTSYMAINDQKGRVQINSTRKTLFS